MAYHCMLLFIIQLLLAYNNIVLVFESTIQVFVFSSHINIITSSQIDSGILTQSCLICIPFSSCSYASLCQNSFFSCKLQFCYSARQVSISRNCLSQLPKEEFNFTPIHENRSSEEGERSQAIAQLSCHTNIMPYCKLVLVYVWLLLIIILV